MFKPKLGFSLLKETICQQSVVFGCVISLFSAPVLADCNGLFKVATAPVAPLVERNGELVTGIMKQSAQTLISKNNLRVDWLILNWARALHMAEQGDVDAIFPALYSSDRSDFLDYDLPPIGHVRTSLYRHTEDSQPLPLSEASIATLRSFEYDPTELKHATVLELADFSQVVGMLEKRRVDYIFGVKEIIEFQIKQLGATHVTEHRAMGNRRVYLALAANSPKHQTMRSCLGLH